jgi:hypothetical protein
MQYVSESIRVINIHPVFQQPIEYFFSTKNTVEQKGEKEEGKCATLHAAKLQ